MVRSATSLGRSGLYDWLIQRFSAVVLGVYLVGMMGFVLCTPDLDFARWSEVMNCTLMRIVNLLVIFSIAAHAWVGLWTIATDYLTTRQLGSAATSVRLVFLALCALATIGYVLWAVLILWGAV